MTRVLKHRVLAAAPLPLSLSTSMIHNPISFGRDLAVSGLSGCFSLVEHRT